MKGKLKKREDTKYIHIYTQNMQGRSFHEIEKDYARRSYLYAPFHAYIDENGYVHLARDWDAIGSSDREGSEDTFFIVINAPAFNRITPDQERTLRYVVAEVQDAYPYSEIVNKDGETWDVFLWQK